MFSPPWSKSSEKTGKLDPARKLAPFVGAASSAAGVFLIGILAFGPSFAQSGGDAITPLVPIAVDPAKVAAGKAIYDDARLSNDGRTSCATCHDLRHGGVDPAGSNSRRKNARSFDTLTVFNAAYNYRLNWIGEFKTLEEANESSITDPGEMATSWSEALDKLTADPGHAGRLTAAYGPGWGKPAVLDALSEYQRSLITPDGRFDRFLKGRQGAITADEERGYRLFASIGCVACHQGRNVGGNLLQKFGVFSDPRRERKTAATDSDVGRFAITGLEQDRNVFRVPSLRNVALTAPYLHDGSVATLEEVVAIMGRTQLGRELGRPDVDLIVKFLRTLTGEYQGVPLDESEGAGN